MGREITKEKSDAILSIYKEIMRKAVMDAYFEGYTDAEREIYDRADAIVELKAGVKKS